MSNPVIIDLSHWQPEPIDWESVKAGGTLGAILKATEGTGYVDETYGHRANHARAAGLFVASYHYLKHVDVREQMQWFCSRVDPAVQERMCIDFEDPDCTFDDLELAVEVLEQMGVQVAVYGSSHLVETVRDRDSAVLAATSLWQARYSGTPPEVPENIWPRWDVWQFTDAASVSGIDGPVDGNRWWNADMQALARWFNVHPAIEAPDAGDALIDVVVHAPAGTIVRVNGQKVVLK